jgi:hypothetical protein
MLPDFWDFSSVTKRGALAQLIGNAVPPVLASSLLEPALRALGLASTRIGRRGRDADGGASVTRFALRVR